MNAITIFDPNSSFNSAKISGYITLHQCDKNTKTLINISLQGFSPNKQHGIHIHEEGDLSKGCDSLCGHYNPFNQLHGNSFLYGKARHVGDMCNNIKSNEKGEVNFKFYDDLIDLYGPYTVIGRSIVIHEKADDLGLYRNEDTILGKESAKTGNAGKRIACSIIGRTKTDFHN